MIEIHGESAGVPVRIVVEKLGPFPMKILGSDGLRKEEVKHLNRLCGDFWYLRKFDAPEMREKRKESAKEWFRLLNHWLSITDPTEK